MRERGRGRTFRFLGVLVVIGAVGLVGLAIVLSQRAALAAPSQPIPFSHQLHSEQSIQCLFCHPNAMRSDVAGIPSVERCIGCHRTIATDHEEIQVLLGYWEQQEPIPWQPVVKMADHVFFSHQPHLLAAVSCESCHGDVGQMETTRPALNMDMGWCLKCHLEQPAEKVAKLADCLACHK